MMRAFSAFIAPCNRPVIMQPVINTVPAEVVIARSCDEQQEPLQETIDFDDNQHPQRPLQRSKAYGHQASLTFHR